MDILHYRGDCTDFDPNAILGPDLFGGHYRIASAEYDAATDRTTATLVSSFNRVPRAS